MCAALLTSLDSVVQWRCFAVFFFFFQAEDGIRDVAVTGVQTCALPISRNPCQSPSGTKSGTKRRDSRRRSGSAARLIGPSLAVAQPRFQLGDGKYRSRGPTFARRATSPSGQSLGRSRSSDLGYIRTTHLPVDDREKVEQELEGRCDSCRAMPLRSIRP